MVQLLTFGLTEGMAEVWIPGVGDDVGELLCELIGYCSGFRVGLVASVVVFEGDGLVWGDSDLLAREGADFVPESLDIGSVGNGGDFSTPL